jgi:hypothetical protein
MISKDPSKTIPTVSSPAESWIQWHTDLKRVFGKKKANSIWVYAWSKRGSENSPANNRSLRSYMESQGVDISKTTLSSIGDGVADFGSGLASFFKWALIIPIALGGTVVLIIAYNLTKNPKNTTTLLNATPKGRLLKGASKLK